MRTNLIKIMVSICTIVVLSSCNQTKLNNIETGTLVIQSLGLPQQF